MTRKRHRESRDLQSREKVNFATGLVDAVSVLVLGHVLIANMIGNAICLGLWFVPSSGDRLGRGGGGGKPADFSVRTRQRVARR